MLAWLNSLRPKERALVVVAGLWILVFLASFAGATIRVRLANSDDVDYQRMEDAGRTWEDSVAQAHAQGRFYMPMAFGPIGALYSIHDPLLFTGVRTALLLLQIVAFCTLIETVAGSRIFAIRVAIVFLLLLQISLPFNLILSYPETGLGFTLFCLSGTLLLSEKRSKTIPGVVAFGFFFASWLNEDFVAPTLLVAGAAYFRKPRKSPAIASAVLAMIVYLAIYFRFRTRYPSFYSGTQFSFDPADVFNVLLRQISATFPGFELAINRYGFETSTFFKPSAVLTDLLLHPGAGAVALLVTGLAIWAALGKLVSKEAPRCSVVITLWACGLATIFILPIAFTEKYQAWTHLRQYPYAYAFYSWAVLVAVFCFLFERFRQTNHSRFTQVTGQLAVLLGLTAGSWCVAASNRHVLWVLEQAAYPLSNDTVHRLGLGEVRPQPAHGQPLP